MSNNRYKILVIEDEDNIRTLVETILQTHDYQVIPTGTCHMLCATVCCRPAAQPAMACCGCWI